MTIDILSNIVSGIKGIQTNFYRPFALKMVPQLKHAIQQFLIEQPEQLLRNLNLKKLESIIQGLGDIILRTDSILEKLIFVEELECAMHLKLFKSSFLQRKIQGLKGLLTHFQGVKQGAKHYLSRAEICQLIEKEKMMEEIFIVSGHPSIIQRSENLI